MEQQSSPKYSQSWQKQCLIEDFESSVHLNHSFVFCLLQLNFREYFHLIDLDVELFGLVEFLLFIHYALILPLELKHTDFVIELSRILYHFTILLPLFSLLLVSASLLLPYLHK